jgi:tripartite-type tricarboxylate transporter receptor subunit TctC
MGVLSISFPAAADPVADFYTGRQLEILVGSPPGASYDAYTRLLARHYGDHIPGKPSIVVMNNPAAGSLAATNLLFNDPQKNGALLGMVGQSNYFMQILGQPNIHFDVPKFNWIGRLTNVIDLVITWHGSQAETIADAKKYKTTISVGGALSGSTLYVNFTNAMIGTKFVPIKGYSAPEAFLAMERGEVDGTGRINWYELQALRGDWLREHKLNILVQVGLVKAKGLEDVPVLPDLADNEKDRKILVALAATDEIGRSILAPPGIPAERLKALRTAFNETMRSKAFLADAEKAKLLLNPMGGEELGKLVVDSGRELTPDMVARIKQMISGK